MMIINEKIEIQRILILLFFLICFFQSSLFATNSESQKWRIKLSYTLMAKGKEFLNKDPARALEYFQRAKNVYPQNVEVNELIERVRDKVEKSGAGTRQKIKHSPARIYYAHKQPDNHKHNEPGISKIENKHIEEAKSRKSSPGEIEVKLPQGKNVIIAEYKGVSKEEEYKAEKQGPTVNTILDLYHPKHKGRTLPYYKDREGLKVTPWLGIRGEYMYEEQPVGIESLMMEAQEFNQRTKEELKRYISFNKKEYHREEVILNYKETWPKFTFINHKEKAKRKYPAKGLWSSNDVYYDNYDRRIYKIEYTIPRIKKLGFLKTTFRYVDNLGYKPNNPAAYIPFNSYLFGLYTAPYSAFLHRTFGINFAYQYSEGEYKRAAEQGWGERKYKENQYWLELDFYNQRRYLRIKPHFEYEKERHYPSYNTWWVRKTGIKIEKELNGNLKYTTDWTYIKYTRNKDPFNPVGSAYPPNHIACSAWNWENELEYEIIRDLKLKLGLDYSNGLGYDGFDNLGIKTEIQLRKPGLIDFRIGYKYVDYFNLNEGIDTVFFKLGLFI